MTISTLVVVTVLSFGGIKVSALNDPFNLTSFVPHKQIDQNTQIGKTRFVGNLQAQDVNIQSDDPMVVNDLEQHQLRARFLLLVGRKAPSNCGPEIERYCYHTATSVLAEIYVRSGVKTDVAMCTEQLIQKLYTASLSHKCHVTISRLSFCLDLLRMKDSGLFDGEDFWTIVIFRELQPITLPGLYDQPTMFVEAPFTEYMWGDVPDSMWFYLPSALLFGVTLGTLLLLTTMNAFRAWRRSRLQRDIIRLIMGNDGLRMMVQEATGLSRIEMERLQLWTTNKRRDEDRALILVMRYIYSSPDVKIWVETGLGKWHSVGHTPPFIKPSTLEKFFSPTSYKAKPLFLRLGGTFVIFCTNFCTLWGMQNGLTIFVMALHVMLGFWSLLRCTFCSFAAATCCDCGRQSLTTRRITVLCDRCNGTGVCNLQCIGCRAVLDKHLPVVHLDDDVTRKPKSD